MKGPPSPGHVVRKGDEVDLGTLEPADVAVELVLGHARGDADLYHETTVELAQVGEPNGTLHLFDGFQTVDRSGNFAYGLRVRAVGHGTSDDALRDLVLWA